MQVVGRRNAAYNCGRDLVNVGNESLEDGESRWLNSDTVLYNWFPYLTLTRSQKLSRAAPRAFGIYVPQGHVRFLIGYLRKCSPVCLRVSELC